METIDIIVIIGLCILVVVYLLILRYVLKHSPVIDDEEDPEFRKINDIIIQNQTFLNDHLL